MNSLYTDVQDEETTVRTFFTGKQVFYANVGAWRIRSNSRNLHDKMVENLQRHDDGKGGRIRLSSGYSESEATKHHQ